jgi:DNA-binding GntR family transcriptional regulator
LKIVDRTNPIPKYLQITSWLKELIENGRYLPGEKGTGTFVAAQSPVELRHKLDRILSFTDLMHASGVEEN